MIIIKGSNRKSLMLADYINDEVKEENKVIVFDLVDVTSLQFQIKREYEHVMYSGTFEELIQDLKSEDGQEIIKDFDVIVFECNITEEQLKLINESEYNQQIIVTVQTNEEVKIYNTDVL